MRMKKQKHLFLCMAMFCLMLCLQPQMTSAASKDTVARKAYAEYLSKSRIWWSDQYFSSSKIQFAVFDVNNDKVPELYLFNPEAYGYQGYYSLYSYIDGKVKEVYHFGNGQELKEYYPSRGVFLDYGGRMGYYPCYYVKMSTSGKTTIDFFSAKEDVQNNGTFSSVTKYYEGSSYNNKREITKSDFQERRERLLGNSSKKTPVLSKNTESNRKRYILQNVNKTSIKLNKSKTTLYLYGEKTCQLKATVTGTSKKVAWSSSKPSVATVSSKGVVTAKKGGTAIITAKIGEISKRCTVSVIDLRKPDISNWKKTHDSATCNCPVPHNGVEYTVTWKKVPGAQGYQVRYKEYEDGRWYTKYSFTKKMKYSVAFSHLSKDIYVKVRAYKTMNGARIYGPWSRTVVKKIR